jgi:hypothetical protein
MIIAMLLALFTLVGDPINDRPPKSLPIVQVLEAGGLDPEPPRLIARVYASGDVIYRGEKAHRTKSDVAALKKALLKMGAYNLTQKQLDKELLDAGSSPAAYRRGGSGKVTLVLQGAKKREKVTLNGPQNYADSKIKSAHVFHDAWKLVLDFSEKAKALPSK